MNRSRIILQIVLVVAVALSLAVGGLVAGTHRADLGADIAQTALASPDTRAEIAATVADELTSTSPLLAALPGLDGLIEQAIGSPALADEVHALVANDVRARFGHQSDPVLIRPSEIVASENPVINLGIQALPDIEIDPPARPADRMVRAANLAGAMLFVIAAAAYLAVRRTLGRSQAAMLAGIGGVIAATGLLVLPIAATLAGPLTAIAASAIITPTLLAMIAGTSALVAARAVLAHTGAIPYRVFNHPAHCDDGAMDFSFEF